MLPTQSHRRLRVRIRLACAHALLVVGYVTPATSLQPGIHYVSLPSRPGAHFVGTAALDLSTGRIPSTFTTRSQGVPHVPQRPSATMAS